MTNIALALRMKPEIETKIKRIVFMGGNIRVPGNASNAAEFNFWFDPEAARIVLRSRIPKKVMFGLDICNLARIRKAEFDQIANAHTPVTDLYREDLGNRYPAFLKKPDATGYMWDSLAAAYLLDPDFVTKSESRYLDVQTTWGQFYGSTVPLDRRVAPNATPGDGHARAWTSSASSRSTKTASPGWNSHFFGAGRHRYVDGNGVRSHSTRNQTHIGRTDQGIRKRNRGAEVDLCHAGNDPRRRASVQDVSRSLLRQDLATAEVRRPRCDPAVLPHAERRCPDSRDPDRNYATHRRRMLPRIDGAILVDRRRAAIGTLKDLGNCIHDCGNEVARIRTVERHVHERRGARKEERHHRVDLRI